MLVVSISKKMLVVESQNLTLYPLTQTNWAT